MPGGIVIGREGGIPAHDRERYSSEDEKTPIRRQAQSKPCHGLVSILSEGKPVAAVSGIFDLSPGIAMKQNSHRLSIIVMVATLAAAILVAKAASAQVATPSLDTTQPVSMPSAAAWRETASDGAGYFKGSGTRELENQQIYQFDTTGMEASFTLQASNFFLDGYHRQTTTNVKLEQYYEGTIQLGGSDSRVNLALAGNDFVTIGLGGRSLIGQVFIDATHDAEETTETRTIGAISMKTLDMLYLGLGFERVKEENSYAVGLTWNNLIGAVALRLGQPGGTRFRVEYAIEVSDEAQNEIRGGLQENIHPATVVTTASCELMFSGLLFAFKGEETRLDSRSASQNGKVVDEAKRTLTQGGVLWIPEKGLSLGFYFITLTHQESFTDNNGLFRVNVGYLF